MIRQLYKGRGNPEGDAVKSRFQVRLLRNGRLVLAGRLGWKERIESLLRHLAATLFALLVVAILAGTPILLIVTSTLGLGDPVRQRAERMLGGTFYTVGIGRVLFNPFRGFILEGLQIRDLTPSRRLLVAADRLSVSPNLESLLQARPRLERISLRDATLDIPLGPSEQPRMCFDHVTAVIACPAEEFRITSCSFETSGIRVSVKGSFRNPKSFAPKPVSPSGPGKTAEMIQSIQSQVQSVHWREGLPLLSVEAGGDLGDTDSLSIERAVFEAGSGEWRGVPFRHLEVALDYRNRRLTLQKLLCDDGRGLLHAAGNADFGAKKAMLEFTGATGLTGVVPLLLGPVKGEGWEWTDPIKVGGELSAEWSSGKPLIAATAQVETGRFLYRSTSWDSLAAGIAWKEGKLLVRECRLTGDPGTLEADLLVAPGDDRLRFKASLRPEKFAPLASGKARESLESLVCTDPLRIEFDGTSPGPDPLAIKGTGRLDLGHASMRGSPVDALSSTFTCGGGAVDFKDISVRMPSGMATGEFICDYRNWEGRFPVVKSMADPVSILMWIDPRIAKTLRDYRFVGSPECHLAGKIGLRDPRLNDLRIELNALSGLGYTLIGKDLPLGPTSGTVRLRGQDLTVDLPRSRLFGGDVAVKAQVSVAPGIPKFTVSTRLTDVDFMTLTKLYFGYDESGGKLSGAYDFSMTGGDSRSMTGKGNLQITDGKVLAMPILGPLSLLLNDIIPGVGYQTAKKATADFTVSDGVIDTRNILIQGTGFSMIGNGRIHYLEDTMEMNMRLNAQGLPGVVLFPVSKILEYESVGSAKHPKWRPKILPKIGSGASQPSPSPSP